MIEDGATHIGVATDHVIESFRNELWAGYKTGEGIEPALWAQFHPLEEALAAMGVAVWPMVELEADDALASAAHLAARDRARGEGLHLDAGQGPRAMRRRRSRRAGGSAKQARCATPRRAREVRRRRPCTSPTISRSSATRPTAIPGIPGIGAKTAAQLINRYGRIEDFPPTCSGDNRERRCCSRSSRRCRPTLRCSRMSSSFAGRAANDGVRIVDRTIR